MKLANDLLDESVDAIFISEAYKVNLDEEVDNFKNSTKIIDTISIKTKTKSIVKEVKVVTPELEVVTLTNKDLNYSYRNSFLKEHKDYICTEVTLEMSYLDKDKIKETMTSRKKRRIDTQPLDKPSAGSVFRNPEGLSAGKLIEDAGLKGYKIGGAKISTKHANFIVNTGNATYEDILELIDYTKKKIKEIYNIDLILEQEIIR